MRHLAGPLALLLAASLAACAPEPDPAPLASAPKPDPAPMPVASAPKPDSAPAATAAKPAPDPAPVASAAKPDPAPVASIGPGGEQPPLEALIEFTPTAVHGTLLNHTESDRELRISVRVVGDDWQDSVPPLVGPDVPVKAGGTSTRWSIALPPLRDGYHQLQVRASTTRGRPYETGFDGHLRVERGVATVIDFGEWYEHTGGAPVLPSPD